MCNVLGGPQIPATLVVGGSILYRRIQTPSHAPRKNIFSKKIGIFIKKSPPSHHSFVYCYQKPVLAGNTPTIIAFIGIHAKMSSGDMVRFMAERAVTDAEELKNFADFGYEFCPQASTPAKFVFRTDYDFKRK